MVECNKDLERVQSSTDPKPVSVSVTARTVGAHGPLAAFTAQEGDGGPDAQSSPRGRRSHTDALVAWLDSRVTFRLLLGHSHYSSTRNQVQM